MKKEKRQKAPRATSVQTARQTGLPFLQHCSDRHNLPLYSALRQSLPVLDAALSKIVRLIGGFTVSCSDKAAERQLCEFLSSVPTGPASSGIDSFLAALSSSLLCYGTGVGELVYSSDGRLTALYNASLSDVSLSVSDNPLIPVIQTADGSPVLHPERILIAAREPDGENPFGVSLLRGLPSITASLVKIYDCIGVNFERMGNLRFAVTYRPSGDTLGDAKAEEIAEAWSAAMKDQTAVRDFVAVGDVDIKVIGGEVTMPEISIPVRALLEQIISKTGLPPFLLGLSWSSTERMSAQQVDILTSELEYYRSVLSPIILKICHAYLRSIGCFCSAEIIWNNISLQDELTLAEARLKNAEADIIERGGEKN